MVLFAVNLVTLGKRRPHSPLNLVSARHAEYSEDPDMDSGALALAERIRYLIRQRKARGMALDKLQGFEEIERDAEAIRRRFLPQPEDLVQTGEHVVTAGERPDIVAARELGDPEQAWRIVTPVLEGWSRDLAPLEEYDAGSHGPERRGFALTARGEDRVGDSSA